MFVEFKGCPLALCEVLRALAEGFIAETIVESERARPDMLDLELVGSEQGVEADRKSRYGQNSWHSFQSSHFSTSSREGSLPLLRKSSAASFRRFSCLRISACISSRSRFTSAHLPGQFHADEVGFAVNADEVVDDLAQLVLDLDDRGIAQGTEPFPLFFMRRAREAIEELACWLITIGNTVARHSANSAPLTSVPNRVPASRWGMICRSAAAEDGSHPGGKVSSFRAAACFEVTPKSAMKLWAAAPRSRMCSGFGPDYHALVADLTVIGVPQAFWDGVTNCLSMRLGRPPEPKTPANFASVALPRSFASPPSSRLKRMAFSRPASPRALYSGFNVLRKLLARSSRLGIGVYPGWRFALRRRVGACCRR